jgi:hypothetical protein
MTVEFRCEGSEQFALTIVALFSWPNCALTEHTTFTVITSFASAARTFEQQATNRAATAIRNRRLVTPGERLVVPPLSCHIWAVLIGCTFFDFLAEYESAIEK